MVGKGGDGGVDAFYVLANGEMVDSETELTPKDPPEFKLLVMQVKSDEGFSPVAVDKFYWFIDDLLDLDRKKTAYHSTYHSDLIAAMRIFKDKLGVVVGETPPLDVECIYVVRKDVEANQDCLKSSENVKQRVTKYFPQAIANFRFVNASGLWAQVQARPPKKKLLTWAAQPMSTQEGEIGLVKLTDYYAFIRDEDDKIAERFFDSNVRGYWPTSEINKQIGETLRATNGPEFWLLNNGVTILTEKTSTAPGFLEVEIHDPQIVNGLQTSRQIYSHFSSGGSAGDNRRVLVRVIKSGDKTIRDEVIRCTNSQNKMPEEALRATDPIHRELEQAFHTKGLYYDRRKGHYRDQGKPVDQIVSIIEVLQSMLSIVLQRPDEARARPRDYVKYDDPYKSVFASKSSLTLYMKTTEICRRVKEFLADKQLESIHRRNIYFYLCMYVCCEVTASAYVNPSAIEKLDVSKLSNDVLEAGYLRVSKKYESLAEKSKDSGGEKDYDSVAKGPSLLKALQVELKRRFSKKKRQSV
jgi:hypothetical protein